MHRGPGHPRDGMSHDHPLAFPHRLRERHVPCSRARLTVARRQSRRRQEWQSMAWPIDARPAHRLRSPRHVHSALRFSVQSIVTQPGVSRSAASTDALQRRASCRHIAPSMEILIITPRFPHPTRTGDTLTVFHLLKHFSHRHTLDLVSCNSHQPTSESIDAISPYCRSVHIAPITPLHNALNAVRAVLRREPIQSLWFYTRNLARIIDRLVRQNRYDIMYAHTLRAARYLTDLDLHFPSLRILAMQISMQLNYRRLARYERNLLYRMIFRYEAARLAHYEPSLVPQFDRTLVISDVDRDAVSEGSCERFIECPHGVTLDTSPTRCEDREPDTIVFSGNMNYRPNIDAAVYFVHEILPLVRSQIPTIDFFIVGANPHARVRALAKHRGVTVTGEVSSVYSWLRRATVGVNSLRAGAGLQNKVLEGMACGLPMIVTSVANEGIKAIPNVHVLSADSTTEFAAKTVSLLKDVDRRRKIGDAARKFIEDNWSWDVHFNRLERLLEEEAFAIRRPV